MQSAFAPVDSSAPAMAVMSVPSQADPVVTATQAQSTNSGTPSRWMPVSSGGVLLAINQLSVMSQNGIEIADALESVARHCPDERLANSLRRIHESVNSGLSFSQAVASHGRYFPATLPPMLAAAEQSGEVPQTLGRVCSRMRGELQMRGTIVGSLIYPAILVGASTVVMSALVLGVLPQFSRVFESMGKPVPYYTQWLLSFGDFCRENGWWGLPLILVMIAAVVLLRSHAVVQRPLGRFLMYSPMVRDAYRPMQAGRVLRTIAGMVQGGVPMLQAVRLSRQTTGDLHWQNLLSRIESHLIDGQTASSAIAEADFVPPETAQMMAMAERTGRVAEVLEDIGAFYEDEGARRIKRLVVALEPMVILVMGVLVAAIVMSVMLPMLDMSTIQ
ncbi:MAG: type II secretion system F family protein [Rubripirellula sp.]